MLKKILTWGGIGLVILAVIKEPEKMSHVAQAIGTGMATVASSLGIFLGNLV